MTNTSDIYNDARNNAVDQAINAANMLAPVYAAYEALRNKNKYSGGDITLPAWTGVEIPNLGKPAISDPGEFTGTYSGPGMGVPTAPDIQTIVENAYRSFDPVSKAAIDAAMSSWLSRFAPDYSVAIASLRDGIAAGIATGQALAEDYESRIYAQADIRITKEQRANQIAAAKAMAKRGYALPQLALSGTLNQIDLSSSDQRVQAATEAAIKGIEMEMDYRKFCMSLAAQIQQMVMSAALQYGEIITNLKRQAVDYAIAKGKMAEAEFEAKVKMFEASLDAAVKQFQALVEVNNAKLSAYKARLEGQLEAKKLEYSRYEIAIKNAQIPYEGELRANITEAQLAVQALNSAIDAAEKAHIAGSRIAEAAMSGLNAIAHVTAED